MSSRAPPHRTFERFDVEMAVVASFGADVVDEARQTSKRLAIGGGGREFAGLAGVRQHSIGGSA
jgi:hypothetical protein